MKPEHLFFSHDVIHCSKCGGFVTHTPLKSMNCLCAPLQRTKYNFLQHIIKHPDSRFLTDFEESLNHPPLWMVLQRKVTEEPLYVWAAITPTNQTP